MPESAVCLAKQATLVPMANAYRIAKMARFSLTAPASVSQGALPTPTAFRKLAAQTHTAIYHPTEMHAFPAPPTLLVHLLAQLADGAPTHQAMIMAV